MLSGFGSTRKLVWLAGMLGSLFLVLDGTAEAQVVRGLPFWAQPYPAYYARPVGGDRFMRHRAARHRLARNRTIVVLHAKD